LKERIEIIKCSTSSSVKIEGKSRLNYTMTDEKNEGLS